MRTPLGIITAIFVASLGAFAQQYNISTIAGGAPPPNNIATTSAPLGNLGAVASDPSGNIYFISDDCVFEDLNGNLVRIAGNSRIGFSGDGSTASNAQLNNPGGIAVDNAGNLYIADSGNNRIRKVTLANGLIGTIAGQGTAGYSGDTGASTNAALNNPQGLAVDSSGNLYIADSGNHVIRKISNGIITTVAGTGTPGASGDGQLATTAQLNAPMGVAVDASLNIYIADSNNQRIREVAASANQSQNGIISTIAGIGVPGYSGDNGSAKSAELNLPTAIAVDTSLNIYVDDFNNQRVRKITSSGVITTVAGGNSGPVKTPSGVAVDPSANLYIDDSGTAELFRFTTAGGITVLAGNGGRYYPGDGGAATSAQLLQPEGMAVEASGIFVADRAEAHIREISPNDVISSPTGANAVGPAGVGLDGAGNIYIADAVGNQILKVSPGGTVTLVAGTGIPGAGGDNSTATLAQLNQPSGVAIDSSGNVYVADTGNNRIRKITFATGIITTIAGNGAATYGGDNGVSTGAEVNQPVDVALDGSGNLYIADTGNNRIRKIAAATGIITTVAGNGGNAYSGDGGAATAASIASPHGVTVDSLGNLYIADYSARVRKVSISGIITTIGGNGTTGYSGDGGPALSAQLSLPWGIAVDGSGNVYVSDVGEQAVRVLLPVAASPLSVTTTSPLPPGTVGTPYAQTLTAAGGTPPYSWSITFGTLPSGLTLSPTGSISGTPTVSGSFLLTFQVTDSASLTASATIGIVIAASSAGGLTITTPPTLVPGAVGQSYSQPLTAISGNPPYNWVLTSGSLPTGLTLSPTGLISGTPATSAASTFTVRVNDNTGNVANQTFSLTVISIGSLTRSGVLGHIAVGGTWDTRIYLTNISTSPVALNLVLHADNGTPLTVPISVAQEGTTQLFDTSSFNGVLNPSSSMIIDCGAQIASTVTGWIDVLSSAPAPAAGSSPALDGFAIFSTTESNGAPPSEGTSPLQTNFESRMDLPFDDTGAFVTGVAVANLSTNATTITATVLDVNGNQLGSYSLQLPASGHTSFLFPSQFAVTTGQQGVVQFLNTNGGGVAGVGLRANTATGTFTSIPVILP
jgi:sugar lactone lactonase YvrE